MQPHAQASSTHPPIAMGGSRRLGEVAARIMGPALLIGVGGVAASIAIAQFSASGGGWDQFFRSYLMAFMFALSICLGALFFTMLQHAVKAGWSVVIRRLAEGVAGNLVWIWVLFLPVVAGLLRGHLYHWNEPGVTTPGAPNFDAVLFQKTPYLNTTFWLIRAAVYFGIWAFLARFFVGNSIKQDSTGDINLTRRMQSFAPVAFILYALSQSFAAIDWVMSLSPHWFSTMFPVYFFAASCCGYFAVQILMMCFMQRNGRLTAEITAEHYQDAGKLLFAFGIVFWAYIGFSQYMLIWYANIPEETPWYLARQLGGWGALSLLLLFGHFLGPFVVLISRHPKRRPVILAGAAMWMVFMHFIDIYWLVMPRVPQAVHHATSYRTLAVEVAANMAIGRGNPGFDPALDSAFGWHLLDFTCVAGLAGLLVLGAAWRLSGCSLIPERDPRLHESLAFENI